MKQATKIMLLSLSLVAAAFVVVRLRPAPRRDGPRPVNLPGQSDADRQASRSPGRVTQQPTILRTKPFRVESGADANASPRYWANEQTPVDGTARAVPLYPTSRFPDGPVAPPPPASLDPVVVPLPAVNAAPSGPPLVGSESPTPDANGFRSPEGGEEAAGPASDPTAPRIGPYVDAMCTEPDDSFWEISERAYGAGGFYKALYAHNRDRVARPDRIPAGITIHTPPPSQLLRLYPDLCPDDLPNGALRAVAARRDNPVK